MCRGIIEYMERKGYVAIVLDPPTIIKLLKKSKKRQEKRVGESG